MVKIVEKAFSIQLNLDLKNQPSGKIRESNEDRISEIKKREQYQLIIPEKTPQKCRYFLK